MEEKVKSSRVALVLKVIGGLVVTVILGYYLLVAAAHTTTVAGDPNGEAMEEIRKINQHQF